MNASDAECPICRSNSRRRMQTGYRWENECPRCGKFEITAEALHIAMTPEVGRHLSGWVRDRNRDSVVPRITRDTIPRMASLPLPKTAERAERLLLEALHGQKRLDNRVNLGEPRFVAATYSWDHSEMLVLFRLLVQYDWIAVIADQGPKVRVTPSGYMAADELTTTRGQSESKCSSRCHSPLK